jgi:phage terminase small subunit
MATKLTKLKLVKDAAPPRKLGTHGGALWKQVMAEYRITDAGGLAMLTQACIELDIAEDCRTQISRDGSCIRTKTGLKEHPLIKHELAARAFVVRTLSRLGLDVEPVKAIGRPTKPIGVDWDFDT